MKLGEKTYADIGEFDSNFFLGSAQTVRKLTKNVKLTNGPCRALAVGVAGTINYTDFQGITHSDFPVTVGYNPIMIKALLSGGTADDIWGLY
jgi:hypothetical protein